MNIKERIMTLVNRALAEKTALEKDTYGDFDAWDKRQNELEAELIAIDKAASKGLVVGRCLSFGVADGNANYIVTKVRKNDVVVEWVPIGDMYFSHAVGLNRSKTEYVVNRHTAEMFCREI